MQTAFLGLDVSRRDFHCSLWLDGRRHAGRFDNDGGGFARLEAWLAERGAERVHACLEATGSYGDGLARYLVARVWRVSVVNPRLIKHYAIGIGARTKTDRYDAAIIADYCCHRNPLAWGPIPESQEAVRTWTRRRDDLVGLRTQEKNRQVDPSLSAAVRESIEALIAFLDRQIAEAEAHAQAAIAADPALAETYELLLTIPGIGKRIAAVLVGELGDCSQFESARQLAAFLGLTPRHCQSGTSVFGRPRMSKAGNPTVRRALYLPALSAMQACPSLREFRERKLREGRPRKLIVGAVMRKLVHLVYGVLRSGQAYDPTYGRATAEA